MQPSFVAAIDFGTTFTGLAFASYPHGKHNVALNKWSGYEGVEVKAPTAVLFDSSGEFASFGFDALREYYEKNDREKLDCYFFKNFKMDLHQESRFDRNKMLCSTNNPEKRVMPIIEVISTAMKFLKDTLMKLLQDEDNQVQDSQVRWVVTVPAIWQAPARQLMREAGYMAGLASKRNPQDLIIALEPESAAISIFENEKAKIETLQKEFRYPKYMIVDCGGGTIDICVHQVMKSGNDEYLIREEYKATGGKWGGIYVDKAFVDHLQSILTEKFIKHIKAKCPTSWYEICRDFEYLKKTVTPTSQKDSSISIPFDIIKEHEKMFGKDIQESFEKTQQKGMKYKMGRLSISASQMKSFLESQSEKIIAHLHTLFSAEKITVNAIYKVGWFSESKILSAAIEEFCSSKNITVVAPKSPSTAIADGAVKYGFNPRVITQRISSFTYGIAHMTKLKPNESVPAKHLYINKEGIKYHKNLFTKAMGLHEKITEKNSKFITEYTPVEKDQKNVGIRFFRSTKDEVKHVTDYETEKFGEFTVPLGDPSKGYNRKIQVTLDFSGTEIFATGKDMQTDEVVYISLDFLSSEC